MASQDDFITKICRSPIKKLNVIVVGAGLGGLALGLGLRQSDHKVTILEQVEDIGEVGAGVQVAPNAARVLRRFGVLDEVMKFANVIEKISLRVYSKNEELGTAPMMPQIEERYGAPLSVIHRGDLQRILVRAAKDSGCEILTNQRVTHINESLEARVKTADGKWYTGDVVIAADGIKSTIRSLLAGRYGHRDVTIPTGDSAYRVLIPKESMEHDKEALSLLKQNVGLRVMGPGGHIMAYPIKNNTVYNMVLIHPAKESTPNQNDNLSWITKGNKSEMLGFYKGWSPLIQNLLTYVPEGDILEWSLHSHLPLPRWVEGRVALMGDACHPMLPYVAQGAANAIEDAGVLVAALASTDDVTIALKVYESVRKERGERIQRSASSVRRTLHLPDGPEQKERDKRIRNCSSTHDTRDTHNPDLWADREWQDFMWGVDVMEVTVNDFDKLAKKAQQENRRSIPSKL